MKKGGEEYEQTIRRKMQLEELARLKIQEFEKLNNQVDNIKNQ